MKLLIYTYTQWAFGMIHGSLARCLRARGWEVAIKDWVPLYPIREFQAECASYDRILTVADAAIPLVNYYGIPREKIVIVAHAEVDIIKLAEAQGRSFEGYAGYGVVSDSLATSSLTLGITRIPAVVRLGVDFERFCRPIADRLESVGHTMQWERLNHFGVEQKRGWLAAACAEQAGLPFVVTNNTMNSTPMAGMPDFYGSVGAVLMPSLQEGAGLPPLEAAAAGRLVIGTPVGHFPRLAYEGCGLLGPLDANAFLTYASKALTWYRDQQTEYRNLCKSAQEAARGRDWAVIISDWVSLLEGP